MAIYLAAFFASFVLSILLTRWVRNLAFARNWVAAPASSRHLHDAPTPRIGGIAIYTSFLTVLGVVLVAARLLRWNLPVEHSILLTILAPATLIFLVGLYDDLRPLSPYWKFAAQALAGAMLFAGGLQVVTLPLLFGSQTFGWFLGLPLTIFWVLLITNAFNLIDGLDGLASGTALLATVTMYVIAIMSGPTYLLVSVLSIILAGAILGFLRFNFNPATIFLGDSGSLLVGFLLSALAIVGNQKSATVVTVAVPVVSFMLPILDTVVSVVRRFINGQPLFLADREHIHHKLLQRGFSQRQVVGILYGVSAAFGLLSLLLMSFGGRALGVVLVVVAAVVWLVVQHLGYHEFFELKRVAQRTLDQKQVMVNNLAVRRVIENLANVRSLSQLCTVLREGFDHNDFDGFHLAVPLSAPHGVADPSEPGLEHRDGELSLSWQRAEENNGPPRPAPSWSLTLDLVTSSQCPCGSFRVYRLYGPRSLMFDVNLLTTAFPVALADALQRTLLPQVASETTAPALHGLSGSKAS